MIRSPLKRGLLLALLVLAGCSSQPHKNLPERRPADVKAQIVRLIPAGVNDRQGWANDIFAAFNSQGIDASPDNLCAVIAVTDQESNFNVDATVAGLPKIAWGEIDRRAASLHIPAFVVRTALMINSPSGKSYAWRLDHVRSEKELSAIFDDFINMAPMGQRLFGNLNPIHTGGPMQVSIDFAEAQSKGYPYPVDGTLRHEVFTRRGGVWFGTRHLLGYPTHYSRPLYRFADFNAGWYASRNAAFQAAVAQLTGIKLALDGDVIRYGTDTPGATELAVRTLIRQLDMSNSSIRRALEQGETLAFEKSALWEKVFILADKNAGVRLPRERLPGIQLESPKITRNLTTAWYAHRVDGRYQRCLTRAK